MNSTEFTYWLQGFFELTGTEDLKPEQVKMIKEHLALVFEKITPDLGPFIPVPKPIHDRWRYWDERKDEEYRRRHPMRVTC